MARPHLYKTLGTAPDGHRQVRALGHHTIYGIKNGDNWVVIGKQIVGQNYTKYSQLFTTSKKVAQNHCDRLNDVFNTDEYRVVEIYTDD